MPLTRSQASLPVDDTPAGAPAGPGCPCRIGPWETVHTFDAPPAGETRFGFSDRPGYRRQLRRCTTCGHIVSAGAIPLEDLYRGEYLGCTYPSDGGIRTAYERILALDPARSDNVGRVRRILDFVARRRPGLDFCGQEPSVLDVGSGLCVFLAAMKAAGWKCTALDPDGRAIRHAREVVEVEAICADFTVYEGSGRYDLVTFNKVLEHVEDPQGTLARSRSVLGDRGFVYIELPDGETALADGPHREEFFVEHLHVFSMASMMLLAGNAGFLPVAGERLREPSGKYTLRAFLVPTPARIDRSEK